MRTFLTQEEMDAVEDQFFTDDEFDDSKYLRRLPLLRSVWHKLCNLADHDPRILTRDDFEEVTILVKRVGFSPIYENYEEYLLARKAELQTRAKKKTTTAVAKKKARGSIKIKYS